MSYELFRKHFSYDSETGALARTSRRNSNGSIDAYGYLIIKFKGQQYKAHRICWLLYYGEWPQDVIDHINGIKTDNRIVNLRSVSQADNVRNRSDSGISIDRSTKGLIAKYTVRVGDIVLRFRSVDDAKSFREKADNLIGITRRIP